jgi:threonine/homoserine/homoserine lactone efflux protein
MTEALFTLLSTTALLLGSPGPAPLALAASGATFGTRNSIPFLLGILSGLTVAIFCASIGLASLFITFPTMKLVCQIIGAGYIIFIAYKIASAPTNITKDPINPPNFKDGFILNLFNPKAYAAFLAIFSQFLLPLENTTYSYLATALACLFVATIVDILWLLFGSVLRPIFAKPTQARIIRIIFALAMLFSVLFALIK